MMGQANSCGPGALQAVASPPDGLPFSSQTCSGLHSRFNQNRDFPFAFAMPRKFLNIYTELSASGLK